MDCKKYLYPGSYSKMSKRVLMLGVIGSSKRVETQSLKNPKYQKYQSYYKQKYWKKNNQTVTLNKVGSNLHDTCSKRNSFFETAEKKKNEKCEKEAYNCYNDTSCCSCSSPCNCISWSDK